METIRGPDRGGSDSAEGLAPSDDLEGPAQSRRTFEGVI
jgi:hypothetical protein